MNVQEERKKFTFRTKYGQIFCGICIRKSVKHILLPEVRKDERGRKKAHSLGSGGSEASGDPFRTSGKPGPQ